MPAKGGNSALTDQDLTDIVEYLNTLQRTDAQRWAIP